MKQLFTLVFALISLGLFAQIRTPQPSPSATVTQNVGLAKVTIEYSRPTVKGRKIFGDLVPFGKVWRTGANRITSIAFDQDVTLNGQKIAAGKYGWYSIPGPKEWTIVLNSDNQQWGAYEYDEKKDVLRLTVKTEALKTNQEEFTIELDNFSPTAADVVLSWEKTAVRFRLEHNPHEMIMNAIATETAKPDANADVFYTAAEYYLDKGLDLQKALGWANKVLETDKNWWSYYLRASIYAKLKQCDKAVADANTALEGAKKDGDTAYIKRCEKILAQCK
jgi:tetratricopeptide (TPR) repeat protein